MAVSGRKGSGFHGSLSRGSEEDFDHRCDPCLTIGQQIEAHGYCVECQEYLCKNCFSYHQRTKASKDHRLLDKANMDRHSPPTSKVDVCTEKCAEHKNEVIKYFCPKHEFLGCNDCIILHHRSCGIDYIPDMCADIGDSGEYRQVMKDLEQKVKEADDIIKLATDRDKEIDSCHDRLIKEIVKFRKEINDRLDELQKKIQADADRKKSVDKQIVQNVLQACADVSADMNQLQSRLHDNNTSKQNGQLYINMKKAESKLKSGEVKSAIQALEKTNSQYKFERNQDMVAMIPKADILGELQLSTCLTLPMKKQTFENITQKDNINVKTKSDQNKCIITGCEVLSPNKLVLADYENEKLKVVNIERKIVVEEKSLDSSPWGIAVLLQDQIAVTMPEKREVFIMTTAGKLTTVLMFPVKGRCGGICFNNGRLYVGCENPSNVFIFDTLGNVQHTIPLKDKIFQDPYYIVYNEKSRLIYLSTGEEGTDSVVAVSFLGDISAVYKYNDLNAPMEMLMLDDGSLLVCCNVSGTIQHISEDLKQSKTKYDGIDSPHSICFSHNQGEIYIGCGSDQVKVLSRKYGI